MIKHRGCLGGLGPLGLGEVTVFQSMQDKTIQLHFCYIHLFNHLSSCVSKDAAVLFWQVLQIGEDAEEFGISS